MVILKYKDNTVATYSSSLAVLKDRYPQVKEWFEKSDETLTPVSRTDLFRLYQNNNVCKIEVQGWEIWFDSLVVDL